MSARARAWWSACLVLVAVGCGGHERPREDAGTPPGDAAVDGGVPRTSDGCIESSGRLPARRLTAAEYDATVRDLFAVRARHGEAFLPEASVLAGPGEASTPSDTVAHAWQYLLAAERVARASRPYLEALARGSCEDPHAGGCAASIVSALGRRVWRRPLGRAEEARLVALAAAAEVTSPVDALERVVTVMLQAPQFLYRLEFGVARDAERASGGQLTGYELATRLSYLLWGSTPDDALLDVAGRGALDSPAGLRVEVARMLRDPRAREQVVRFHREWFGYDAVLGLAKDASLFPEHSRAAAMRMVADTDAWFRRAIEDSKQGALAAFLPGAMTQPSLLASLAHPTQGSPVRRGYFVRSRILCQFVPPPPPDIVFAVDEPSAGETTRERFAAVSDGALCTQCHERIDPIGYTFEHYDAVGAWRDEEGGRPIDSRGFLAGTDVDGEYADAEALARALGSSTVARDCAVTQAFRWAFGRTEQVGDACLLATMRTAFGAGGHRVADLLALATASDAFRALPPATGEGACR